MSSEVAVAAPASPARALALRIAFGMVLGFVLSGVFRLDFFFLPSLLAVQMLATMGRPPSLAQGAVVLFLISLLAVITLVVSSAFTRHVQSPLPGAAPLVVSFGFQAQPRGPYRDRLHRSSASARHVFTGCAWHAVRQCSWWRPRHSRLLLHFDPAGADLLLANRPAHR